MLQWEEFKKIARAGKIIPLYRRLKADLITPVMAYLKMRNNGKYSFLLESVIKGEQVGRYSFIGSNPYKVLICHPSFNSNGTENLKYVPSPGKFFGLLKQELNRFHKSLSGTHPRLTSGAIGYIGYDMIRGIERLPAPQTDPIRIPDAIMGFYQDIIVFDHLKNEIILYANAVVEEETNLHQIYQEAVQRLNQMVHQLNQPLDRMISFSADISAIRSNFQPEDFQTAVEKIKDHIFSGNIFQAVLSQRFQVPFTGDVFQVYRALRTVNPSPYLFYLNYENFQIIGASPEPLIRVENGEAEIVPIAGTRQRGKNEEEDHRLEQDLLNDPKELAEHLMLVDLARNDMGRVSRYGTVRVEDFQTIEKYSHVMHIISRVRGKLNPRHDSVDAFMAAFPAGTVSGAPKIRAMEILNELEPHKRGFYAGAIGYFDFNGNMDMCIAIRTLLAKAQTLYWQAGAGIVADSIPHKEYLETLNKGKALQKAIEVANGGLDDFIH